MDIVNSIKDLNNKKVGVNNKNPPEKVYTEKYKQMPDKSGTKKQEFSLRPIKQQPIKHREYFNNGKKLAVVNEKHPVGLS